MATHSPEGSSCKEPGSRRICSFGDTSSGITFPLTLAHPVNHGCAGFQSLDPSVTPLVLQLDFGHLDSDVVSRPLIIEISEHCYRNDKRPDSCCCQSFPQSSLLFEFFRPRHLIPAMRDR